MTDHNGVLEEMIDDFARRKRCKESIEKYRMAKEQKPIRVCWNCPVCGRSLSHYNPSCSCAPRHPVEIAYGGLPREDRW